MGRFSSLKYNSTNIFFSSKRERSVDMNESVATVKIQLWMLANEKIYRNWERGREHKSEQAIKRENEESAREHCDACSWRWKMAKSTENIARSSETCMSCIRCNMECSSGSWQNDVPLPLARMPCTCLGISADDNRCRNGHNWYGAQLFARP